MKNVYVEDFLIDKKTKQIYFIELDVAFEYPQECEVFFENLLKSKNYLSEEILINDSLYNDMIELFEEVGVLRNTPPINIEKPNQRLVNIISCSIYFIVLLGIIFSVAMYPIISEVSLFSNNVLISFISLFVFTILLNLLHELGHYLYVKKILHLPAKIRINHRSYIFVVFECEMNGITVLPRKEKNSALLAGIAVDNFIIIISSLLFIKYKINFLAMILFIQITKSILHLLIAYKTDVYYLIKFNFKNANIDFFKKISYILVIFVIYLYIKQVYFIFTNINLNIINIFIILLILSISVIVGLFKRKEKV